jgi:calcium/calmodulin-dependent protein kinase kinase 2
VNTGELVEPPTEAEMETAITGNVAHLLTVVRAGPLVLLAAGFTDSLQMKAVNKFKKLVANKRPAIMSSILGEEDSSRFSQPPLSMRRGLKAPPLPHKSQSVPTFDRRAVEGALVVEGVHRDIDMVRSPDHAKGDHHEDQTGQSDTTSPGSKEGASPKATESAPKHSGDDSLAHGLQVQLSRETSGAEEEEQYLAFRPEHPPSDSSHARSYDEAGKRGHAHDPLQDHLYLYIGPSTFSGASGNADRRATFAPDEEEEEVAMVSESPGAADIDIYETAYRDEIERIRQRCKDEGKDEEEPTVYLTRRVDARLFAVGQLAGRFKAKSGEGLDRFGTATGWKDKKARVTDVSRALRDAAREEYEKRRQERRQKYRKASAQPAAEPDASTEDESQVRQQGESGTQSPESGTAQSRTPSMFAQSALGGRAMEKGRQAKTSFKSLMSIVKERSNASKDDKESP